MHSLAGLLGGAGGPRCRAQGSLRGPWEPGPIWCCNRVHTAATSPAAHSPLSAQQAPQPRAGCAFLSPSQLGPAAVAGVSGVGLPSPGWDPAFPPLLGSRNGGALDVLPARDALPEGRSCTARNTSLSEDGDTTLMKPSLT